MTLHVFLISDFSLIHDGISALFKAENQNIELIRTSTLFAQAIDDIGEPGSKWRCFAGLRADLL